MAAVKLGKYRNKKTASNSSPKAADFTGLGHRCNISPHHQDSRRCTLQKCIVAIHTTLELLLWLSYSDDRRCLQCSALHPNAQAFNSLSDMNSKIISSEFCNSSNTCNHQHVPRLSRVQGTNCRSLLTHPNNLAFQPHMVDQTRVHGPAENLWPFFVGIDMSWNMLTTTNITYIRHIS